MKILKQVEKDYLFQTSLGRKPNKRLFMVKHFIYLISVKPVVSFFSYFKDLHEYIMMEWGCHFIDTVSYEMRSKKFKRLFVMKEKVVHYVEGLYYLNKFQWDIRTCNKKGHDYRESGYANPESGVQEFTCNRCGHYIRNILY